MFVLLQLYPPEAADHDERDCLDVIAIGSRSKGNHYSTLARITSIARKS